MCEFLKKAFICQCFAEPHHFDLAMAPALFPSLYRPTLLFFAAPAAATIMMQLLK
jgi:hypothetical protein